MRKSTREREVTSIIHRPRRHATLKCICIWKFAVHEFRHFLKAIFGANERLFCKASVREDGKGSQISTWW